jgi:hypothetical protein
MIISVLGISEGQKRQAEQLVQSTAAPYANREPVEVRHLPSLNGVHVKVVVGPGTFIAGARLERLLEQELSYLSPAAGT